MRQPPSLPKGWDYKRAEPSHLDCVLAFYDAATDGMPMVVVSDVSAPAAFKAGRVSHFNRPFHREIVRTRTGEHLGQYDFLCFKLDGWAGTEEKPGDAWPFGSLWLCRPWTGMGTEVWCELLYFCEFPIAGILHETDPDLKVRLDYIVQLPDFQTAYRLADQFKLRPILDRQAERAKRRIIS